MFSGNCDPDGNITIDGRRAERIVFWNASDDGWEFRSPWIEFRVPGNALWVDAVPNVLRSLGGNNTSRLKVTISDANNQGNHTSVAYDYRLITDQGPIHPKLTNIGG